MSGKMFWKSPNMCEIPIFTMNSIQHSQIQKFCIIACIIKLRFCFDAGLKTAL